MGAFKLVAVLVTMMGSGLQEDPGDDRLYGRVTTSSGDVIEGYLRWDRNEGSWGDVLNGNKEIPWAHLREAERLDDDYRRRRARERSIRFLGIRISWDEDDDQQTNASSGIRFGHIRSLEVRTDRSAILVLKNGEEVEFHGGSTDIGRGLRRLIVEEADGRETDLRWRDIEVVDFMPAPRDVGASRASRLYGTVVSWAGDEFTGYIAWDADEIFSSDVLDGDERGRSREIEFSRIRTIRRGGASSARVVLRNGEEMTLRGTNDVDDGNRGIAISDPGIGQVTVGWDEFESVTFHEATAPTAPYEAFDGGQPLYGRVETEGGEVFEGFIRWDNDEEYSWELLDGEDSGVVFDVEFGNVETILKRGSWGVDVELRDGRGFSLEGSNDVDDGNKGIFITLDDGEVVLVHWDDFDRLTLAHG